jgi:hypothetical protein
MARMTPQDMKTGLEDEHEHPILDIEEENNLPQLQTPVMEPGSSSTCRVVSASSPNSICLRRLDEEESFYQMSEGLTTYQKTHCSTVLLRHWKEGDTWRGLGQGKAGQDDGGRDGGVVTV